MLRDRFGAYISANTADAECAGLVYVNDADPGITRSLTGKGFAYRLPSGRKIDAQTKSRIKSLAVPPAWTDVWICTSSSGHIQATGRDARGRKQYRYHPAWLKSRDETKFSRILEFAKALPSLRKRLRRHMRRRRLDREKVLATVVTLLDLTLIRVGNREYARDNGSFGLTTLQDRHATFSRDGVRFRFRGKTGKVWRLAVTDRRIARIVRGCQDLPGQHLFQYESADGIHAVTSDDVNAYLRSVTGEDISAKDFRTWAGTVLAAVALSQFPAATSEAAAKRNITAAIKCVALRLGNTPAICRKCYVHPEVVACYSDGGLVRVPEPASEKESLRQIGELTAAEAATLALLRRRLRRTPARSRRAPAASI
jgi:DNA topoisomerase-1